VADAHCHLDAMGVPVADSVAAATAVGVTRLLTVGDTVAASGWCVRTAAEHEHVWAAVAAHPTEVAGLTADDYAQLEKLASEPRVVAIGETGLDYYWDRTEPAVQQAHFRRHLQLAKDAGKPVMIHDREAHADVLRILRDEGPPPAGVMFHSFSGGPEMARVCADAGYYMSISGVITFRNAPLLRDAASVIPLDRLLVETDAPFLTPVPFRGRPNAPYLVPWTVRALAALRDIPEKDMCDILTANAQRLFGW